MSCIPGVDGDLKAIAIVRVDYMEESLAGMQLSVDKWGSRTYHCSLGGHVLPPPMGLRVLNSHTARLRMFY